MEVSTRTILITGSKGFIGKNLVLAIGRRNDVKLMTFDVEDDLARLETLLSEADVVYHLAGVNRPEKPEDFKAGNADLTARITESLQKSDRKASIVLASSIQASLDNPYGKSKKAAEEILSSYAQRTGAQVCIYRLPGVFGKWSRPNYNTVVATFCHNIARGLPISISDPARVLELVYIDDVIQAFLQHLDPSCSHSQPYWTVPRSFRVTLGELAERINAIHNISASLTVPDLADELMRCLYATYLSFVPEDGFSSPVKLNTDNRGWLFELIKSRSFGQIFVSKTHPGVTRGNHYHDTKLEKFCVIQGEGIIRFRHVLSKEVIEYPVNDQDIRIVDIPPGYTHSIENTGKEEMITLFWANQIFDPEKPDTYFSDVIKTEPEK